MIPSNGNGLEHKWLTNERHFSGNRRDEPLEGSSRSHIFDVEATSSVLLRFLKPTVVIDPTAPSTAPPSINTAPPSTDHQQEDNGLSAGPVSAAVVIDPTAPSTARPSINTASAANMTPAGPPTSTDLIHFQPAYSPANWVSLGDAVDDYRRDQRSRSPAVQPPIDPPTTPNRQRTRPAPQTPGGGSRRRRERALSQKFEGVTEI